MGSWSLLFSIGGALAGVLVFLALVTDEVRAIELHLEYRRRIEAEEAAKRRGQENETAG